MKPNSRGVGFIEGPAHRTCGPAGCNDGDSRAVTRPEEPPHARRDLRADCGELRFVDVGNGGSSIVVTLSTTNRSKRDACFSSIQYFRVGVTAASARSVSGRPNALTIASRLSGGGSSSETPSLYASGGSGGMTPTQSRSVGSRSTWLESAISRAGAPGKHATRGTLTRSLKKRGAAWPRRP